MSLAHNFRAFWKLGWTRRLALLEAMAALAGARATIAFRPASSYLRAVAGNADDDAAALVQWAVETASHHVPFRALCLPQAVAARRMLARRGTACQLEIGTAQGSDGTVLAHAWVTSNGRVVAGEAERERYIALSRSRGPLAAKP